MAEEAFEQQESLRKEAERKREAVKAGIPTSEVEHPLEVVKTEPADPLLERITELASAIRNFKQEPKEQNQNIQQELNALRQEVSEIKDNLILFANKSLEIQTQRKDRVLVSLKLLDQVLKDQ